MYTLTHISTDSDGTKHVSLAWTCDGAVIISSMPIDEIALKKHPPGVSQSEWMRGIDAIRDGQCDTYAMRQSPGNTVHRWGAPPFLPSGDKR